MFHWCVVQISNMKLIQEFSILFQWNLVALSNDLYSIDMQQFYLAIDIAPELVHFFLKWISHVVVHRSISCRLQNGLHIRRLKKNRSANYKWFFFTLKFNVLSSDFSRPETLSNGKDNASVNNTPIKIAIKNLIIVFNWPKWALD